MSTWPPDEPPKRDEARGQAGIVGTEGHCDKPENTASAPTAQQSPGAEGANQRLPKVGKNYNAEMSEVCCTKTSGAISVWGTYTTFAEARAVAQRLAEVGCSGVFVREKSPS